MFIHKRWGGEVICGKALIVASRNSQRDEEAYEYTVRVFVFVGRALTVHSLEETLTERQIASFFSFMGESKLKKKTKQKNQTLKLSEGGFFFILSGPYLIYLLFSACGIEVSERHT